MTIVATGRDPNSGICFNDTDLATFKQEHPHLLASALYLRLKKDLPEALRADSTLKWKYNAMGGGNFVAVFPPDNITQVTPLTIGKFFRDGYGYCILGEKHTLTDLVHSIALEPVNFDTLEHIYYYNRFDE